ncbi:MAG TPA: hypothetical protein PLB18_00150, partial [Acidobacteriota bacterium]|nr:hypothetical protein [Acidobacteriota bacterium]
AHHVSSHWNAIKNLHVKASPLLGQPLREFKTTFFQLLPRITHHILHSSFCHLSAEPDAENLKVKRLQGFFLSGSLTRIASVNFYS